jgi:hypothetical protein
MKLLKNCLKVLGALVLTGLAGELKAATNCSAPSSSLVSWWRAENNFSDAKGTNNGNASGVVTFGQGKVGQAFRLDGTCSVVVPSSPSLSISNELTVELWFKGDGWIQGAAQTFFDKRTFVNCNYGANISPDYGLSVYYNDPNVTGGDYAFSGYEMSAYSPLPTIGEWHHLAATFRQLDSSNILAITYIDGVSVKSLQMPGNLGSAINQAGLTIGGARDGAGEFFSGHIDEVALYSKALTAEEVLQIKEAGASGKCFTVPPVCVPQPAGMISWWRAENNYVDSKGFNSGGPSGSITFETGKVGQAFRFNGSSSVVIPSHPTLSISNELTVELWFKTDGWIQGASQTFFDKRTFVDCNYGAIISPDYGLSIYYNDPSVTGGDYAFSGYEMSAYYPLPSEGVWHHLAATFKQTNSSTILALTYIDGVKVKSLAMPGNLASTFNEAALTIGGAQSGAGEFFRGLIDEVAVYNRALAAEEIMAIKQSEGLGKCNPPPMPTGGVGQWKFENNTQDSIGTNNGTLTGPSNYGPGQYGTGLNLSGGFVHVPASSSLNVSQGPGFSLTAWIKPASVGHEQPIAEWNGGPIGVHFWISVLAPSGGGGGVGGLFANLVDQSEVSHQVTTPPGAIKPGVYQHVTLTYDKASGATRLYIDGQLAASTNLGSLNLLTSGPLYFGNRPSGPATGARFIGGLDEITLFNRALTAQEVAGIFDFCPLTQPLTVTFVPSEVLFTNISHAELSANHNSAVIYYTLDGSEPTRTSHIYSEPIRLSAQTTIKARAVLGDCSSDTVTKTYSRVYAINDGIPASWREQFFGAGYLTDPRVAGTADPDADGQDNFREYLAGTDPTDPNSVFKIVSVHLSPTITWSSISNKTYSVIKKTYVADGPTITTNWFTIGSVLATNSLSSFTDITTTNRDLSIYQVEIVP